LYGWGSNSHGQLACGANLKFVDNPIRINIPANANPQAPAGSFSNQLSPSKQGGFNQKI
jgi:hypothetical protein